MASESRIRLFVAVFPPPEVQRAAHAMGEGLRTTGDGVSWVKPDNLHYTLRFIGEVGEDGARRVAEAAADAAAKQAPFDAVLGDLGAFPNAHRARVIWAGLASGGPELLAVARDLESSLRRVGFDAADKPFSAHLTLGRARDPRADWSDRLAAARAIEPRPRFRVDRLRVVQSRLDPRGSIYTVRSEAMLARSGS